MLVVHWDKESIMSERMGANGMPVKKKVVTWDEMLDNESNGTLQEILSVNPNASSVDEETVVETTSKRKKLK